MFGRSRFSGNLNISAGNQEKEKFGGYWGFQHDNSSWSCSRLSATCAHFTAGAAALSVTMETSNMQHWHLQKNLKNINCINLELVMWLWIYRVYQCFCHVDQMVHRSFSQNPATPPELSSTCCPSTTWAVYFRPVYFVHPDVPLAFSTQQSCG